MVFSVRLVDPISREITGDDFVGSVVQGNTLELLFSREFGSYDSLQITTKLPAGFSTKVVTDLEVIRVLITVPPNAQNGSYDFGVNLLGKNKKSEAKMYFIVDDSLVDASLNNYSSESFVDSESRYSFLLVNDSDADAKFTIENNLPWTWVVKDWVGCVNCQNVKTEVVVGKNSSQSVELIVYPRVAGQSVFNATVTLSPSKTKEFSLLLSSNHTLKSRIESVLFGFPFYSFSLLPSISLNGLFASFG